MRSHNKNPGDNYHEYRGSVHERVVLHSSHEYFNVRLPVQLLKDWGHWQPKSC